MGSKKGQLFIVGIIFLLSLIFAVQQALFQYSEINISEPFKIRDAEILSDIIQVVNQTIRDTHSCDQTKDNFENRVEELRNSFLDEYGRTYSSEISYVLECANWDNTHLQAPPLTMTISISGSGKDTRGTFNFYHNQ